jgi:Recombination endonuclease VII
VCQLTVRNKPPETRSPAAKTVGGASAAGQKWCPDCGEIKPVAEFVRTIRKSSGLHSYCKPCHIKRGVESKTRHHGSTREYHLRRRYGITQKDFEELLAEQGGVCAICGAPDPEHVDHEHVSGYVRGVLCFNCNGGLGQFRDSIQYLDRAIDYLKGTTWQLLIHPGVYRPRSPRRGRRPSRSS